MLQEKGEDGDDVRVPSSKGVEKRGAGDGEMEEEEQGLGDERVEGEESEKGQEGGEEESSESDSEDRPLGAQFRADAAMKRKRACDDSDDDADDESD